MPRNPRPLLTAMTILTGAAFGALGCADNPASPGTAGTADPPGTTDNTPNTGDPADATPPTPAALDFEMASIDGETIDLAGYHGQVVLVVNTASECGLTPQYEQLQALHEQYADAGLAILGFPANNFGAQEPGSDGDIAAFCEQNYGVGFQMFAKVSVKGEDQTPLYAFLTGEDTNPGFAGDITWNFEKFLIGRDGRVVARYEPRTRPDAEEVVGAIRAELAKPAPDTGQSTE